MKKILVGIMAVFLMVGCSSSAKLNQTFTGDGFKVKYDDKSFTVAKETMESEDYLFYMEDETGDSFMFLFVEPATMLEEGGYADLEEYANETLGYAYSDEDAKVKPHKFGDYNGFVFSDKTGRLQIIQVGDQIYTSIGTSKDAKIFASIQKSMDSFTFTR